jgi:ornithine cyclodeaminase/alanine dehydrogenase-like protein (mu-crystallin family)
MHLHAKVVVDDWEQASFSSEINSPLLNGTMRKEDTAAVLARLLQA